MQDGNYNKVALICRRRLGGGGRREAVGAIKALVDGAVLAKMAHRLLGWCWNAVKRAMSPRA